MAWIFSDAILQKNTWCCWTDEYHLEYWERCRALPAQPKVEIKKQKQKEKTSKQQASIDKQAHIGYYWTC
jgi:hypothetical protein